MIAWHYFFALILPVPDDFATGALRVRCAANKVTLRGRLTLSLEFRRYVSDAIIFTARFQQNGTCAPR